MDSDAMMKYLMALKKMNEILLAGLKGAVSVLERVEDLTLSQRQSIIDSLEEMIEQSEKAFEKVLIP
jgi:hypothetical protein